MRSKFKLVILVLISLCLGLILNLKASDSSYENWQKERNKMEQEWQVKKAFFTAIHNNDINYIDKAIADGFDLSEIIEYFAQDGHFCEDWDLNALFFAVFSGKKEVVELLVDKYKVDINQKKTAEQLFILPLCLGMKN